MWWTWCIAGLILLGLEMVLPSGFFLFFFGVGALLTGAFVLLIGGGLEAWSPWVVFSLSSVVSLLLFRTKLKVLLRRGSEERSPELSGELGIVLNSVIPAAGNGIVELRGTSWQAKNGGSTELPVGSRVRVRAVNGLTVEVVPE
jgi:membrane protein implicated in regulation of membrane protease activity